MIAPKDLHPMPREERIKRYRQLAESAAGEAVQARTSDGRKSFLMLAAGWHQLADALERDPDPR